MSNPPLPSQTLDIGKDDATRQSLVDQLREQDTRRRTHLTDISKVRTEMHALLDFRKQNPRLPKSRIIIVARECCPYVKTKFPTLYNAAINCSRLELDDFDSILEEMLPKLEMVQQGAMTQEECTDKVLNQDLAKRFYRRTDGGPDPFKGSR